MKEYKEKLLFWDQDILNLYFDGQYEPLPSSLNFKIDMDIDNKALNITNSETQEILIIHLKNLSNIIHMRLFVILISDFHHRFTNTFLCML